MRDVLPHVRCDTACDSPDTVEKPWRGAGRDGGAPRAYGRRGDGTYGVLGNDVADHDGGTGRPAEAEAAAAAGGAGDSRTISLQEFRRHTGRDSLWVAYAGEVYDVTEFVAEHPGGVEALLSAGGQALEDMWQAYQVHFSKDVLGVLAPYRIGSLSAEDHEALLDTTNPENAGAHRPLAGEFRSPPVRRAAARSARRSAKVWAVAFTAVFWWCTRGLLRSIGFLLPWLGPRLAGALSALLPCSVPGYSGAAPLAPGRGGCLTRVAVVGGGISGCACAFSLSRSGYDVTLYESRAQLGGNAQTATFPVGAAGGGGLPGKAVTQDLSVLFWAPEYYRNYTALVGALGLQTATVQMPYVLHTNASGRSEYYTPPGSDAGLDRELQPSLEGRFARDFARYDRMVRCVRRANQLFAFGSSRQSFYKTNQYEILPLANPFNFIGLRSCARLFGMSAVFFDTVLAPFHGLSLSTIHIDGIAASGFPILDDIAPLHRSRCVMTWGEGNSQEVLRRATRGCAVKLGTRVRQVHCVSQRWPPAASDAATSDQQGVLAAAGSTGEWQQVVIDDQGGEQTFDRVVFACPASAAANILRSTTWLERALLQGVTYHDEFQKADWRDWLESPVHQDASCLPERHRGAIRRHAAFVIDVDEWRGRLTSDGGRNVEYTHNLGAFSPAVRSAGVAADEAPMFMTQCPHAHRHIDPSLVLRSFSAPRAHPDLSYGNLVITQMLHLVQGRRGVYFCSNWTSPGNGHDLACTSGLAVASAIGAEYPLPCPEAKRDFHDCRRFMCI